MACDVKLADAYPAGSAACEAGMWRTREDATRTARHITSTLRACALANRLMCCCCGFSTGSAMALPAMALPAAARTWGWVRACSAIFSQSRDVQAARNIRWIGIANIQHTPVLRLARNFRVGSGCGLRTTPASFQFLCTPFTLPQQPSRSTARSSP